MNRKIQNFYDLDAWKESHELVLMIYQITKQFPDEERYGLVSQMRRCVVSITSNIAEGFGRASIKEKIRFYAIAQGSITELQNQIIISKDVKLIKEQTFKELFNKTITAHKITSGLIRSLKKYL